MVLGGVVMLGRAVMLGGMTAGWGDDVAAGFVEMGSGRLGIFLVVDFLFFRSSLFPLETGGDACPLFFPLS